MRDLESLAQLSHAIEACALTLCTHDPDDRRIQWYLEALSEGEREAVAIALSYALRRRELEGHTPLLDRTVALLAETVRHLQPPN